MSEINFGIAIHGGAGTMSKSDLTPEKEANYRSALATALDSGFAVLNSGGTALLAVEAAVVELENSPLFNAGKGSVFNSLGKHEMDASIMEGHDLQAGAVAAIKNIKNPIKLAHKILTHSDHVLLVGDGANEFSKNFNVDTEPDEYFYNEYRYQQWLKIKDSESFQLDHSKSQKPNLGTVGAVALDKSGCLVAGTSTGGMTNKKFGRIGDSPLIGLGNYANNKTCAISCTGSGEYFMRGVSAHDVSCLMEYKGLSIEEAADLVIMNKLTELGGDGGLIGIDKAGNIHMPFNCEGMYRGSQNLNHRTISIYK